MDYKSKDGSTPLHLASEKGNIETVVELLKHDASCGNKYALIALLNKAEALSDMSYVSHSLVILWNVPQFCLEAVLCVFPSTPPQPLVEE